jgi:signal transduction histidine kinase/ActR/RegA family two-component response regulator
LYTFPLFSLYLLGFKNGAVATGILFTVCTIFLIIDLSSDTISVYNSRDFSIRFIPSYLLIFALACLVENSRATARRAMREKQQALARVIIKLQVKEAELEEARDQLELRVKLRTAEIEQANKHLRVEMEERKWAEEERIRLEAELLRSQKMELLGRLAGGVAHDLNNVLSGIVSYPDLLLLDLPPESEMREPLGNIQQAGKRAAAIVQDLLTLARRGITIKEQVQLNDIINDYLQSLEYINLKKNNPGVLVKTRFTSDLKTLSGSPIHLSKMVMNLVINAFEAIEGGKGTISIKTKNRHIGTPVQGYDTIMPGEYVVLSIKDSGVGIPEESLGRIFEPFYTSKIMGRSGTGLGMTVVWGTVKDHNGYLDVESTSGAGTTITVLLPATLNSTTNTTQVKPESKTLQRGNGEIILLVDDAPEQRSLGNSILTTLGYRTETAASGEDALQLLAKRSVDLILLDMIMDPGMDGLNTYRKILDLHPDQKVIIVSGYSETKRMKKAVDLGVRSVVKKPYTLQTIAAAIHKELTNR